MAAKGIYHDEGVNLVVFEWKTKEIVLWIPPTTD